MCAIGTGMANLSRNTLSAGSFPRSVTRSAEKFRNARESRGGCRKPEVVAIAGRRRRRLTFGGDAVLFDARAQLGAREAQETSGLRFVLPRFGECFQNHLAF